MLVLLLVQAVTEVTVVGGSEGYEVLKYYSRVSKRAEAIMTEGIMVEIEKEKKK